MVTPSRSCAESRVGAASASSASDTPGACPRGSSPQGRVRWCRSTPSSSASPPTGRSSPSPPTIHWPNGPSRQCQDAQPPSWPPFLDKLIREAPFAITGIQVDGGSEFRADFEQACQDKGLDLYVLSPKAPAAQRRGRAVQCSRRQNLPAEYLKHLQLRTPLPSQMS